MLSLSCGACETPQTHRLSCKHTRTSHHTHWGGVPRVLASLLALLVVCMPDRECSTSIPLPCLPHAFIIISQLHCKHSRCGGWQWLHDQGECARMQTRRSPCACPLMHAVRMYMWHIASDAGCRMVRVVNLVQKCGSVAQVQTLLAPVSC